MKKFNLVAIASLLAISLLSLTVPSFAQTGVTQSLTNLSNRGATYRAYAKDIAIATSPSDIFILNGSATKTIYVKKITFVGAQTLAATLNLDLVHRTVANAGGTATALTEYKLDSGNATATAVAQAYTGNPTTIGTGVTIGGTKYHIVPITPTVQAGILTWTFGETMNQNLVLRGVAQGVALSLTSNTSTGAKASIEIEWIEQ